jgi:hypothetical protein
MAQQVRVDPRHADAFRRPLPLANAQPASDLNLTDALRGQRADLIGLVTRRLLAPLVAGLRRGLAAALVYGNTP